MKTDLLFHEESVQLKLKHFSYLLSLPESEAYATRNWTQSGSTRNSGREMGGRTGEGRDRKRED